MPVFDCLWHCAVKAVCGLFQKYIMTEYRIAWAGILRSPLTVKSSSPKVDDRWLRTKALNVYFSANVTFIAHFLSSRQPIMNYIAQNFIVIAHLLSFDATSTLSPKYQRARSTSRVQTLLHHSMSWSVTLNAFSCKHLSSPIGIFEST